MNITELVTPKNIQVGKFYLNKEIPGIIYVGVGKNGRRGFKNKTLVCIKSNNSKTINPFFIVHSPTDVPGVWFNFYLAPDQELVRNEIFK